MLTRKAPLKMVSIFNSLQGIARHQSNQECGANIPNLSGVGHKPQPPPSQFPVCTVSCPAVVLLSKHNQQHVQSHPKAMSENQLQTSRETSKAHHVKASNQNWDIALVLIAIQFTEMLNSCIYTSAKKFVNYNRTLKKTLDKKVQSLRA